MLATCFFAPPVKEAKAVDAFTDISDLLSDSAPNVMATSTITFTTASSTDANDYWRVVFHDDFDLSSINVECAYGDANFTASTTGQMVDCVYSGGGEAAGTSSQIIVGNHINASTTGTYLMVLEHRYDDHRLIERADFMVSIQPSVDMTARVRATLTFDITGVATTTAIAGGAEICDRTTTPTLLDFGTLAVGASTTLCHELDVSTNASDGYIVTVEQDGNLRNANNDDINSFHTAPSGTGSSTATYTWETPVAVLDNDDTYGHMGVFSDDQDLDTLGGYLDFWDGTSETYAGLNGTEPMTIMHHDGPTPVDNQNTGQANVAYTAEINALQQAGDYESVITYICTPTY